MSDNLEEFDLKISDEVETIKLKERKDVLFRNI